MKLNIDLLKTILEQISNNLTLRSPRGHGHPYSSSIGKRVYGKSYHDDEYELFIDDNEDEYEDEDKVSKVKISRAFKNTTRQEN